MTIPAAADENIFVYRNFKFININSVWKSRVDKKFTQGCIELQENEEEKTLNR